MNQKTQKNTEKIKKMRTSAAKTSRGPQREKQTPRYRRRAILTKGAPGRGQGNKTDTNARIKMFRRNRVRKKGHQKTNRKLQQAKKDTEAQLGHEKTFEK